MSGVGARFRIVVTDRSEPDSLAPLRAEPAFDVVERPGLRGAELAEALVDADVVLARTGTPIDRGTLARTDRLRIIARPGVGVDSIDIPAASERGVAVLNAPTGNTLAAAEHTFALLLSLLRGIPRADRSMREQAWERGVLGAELNGRTLGVVGVGRIGREVLMRARAFGMDALAADPLLSAARAAELGAELLPLDALLERADVVTLHTPLTPATRGLLDARRLGRMREGAYLVNAARGGIVDEAALIEALESGSLAGAALDVFAEEPLPADSPLRLLPDLVLTPHLGAATVEARRRSAVEITGALRRTLLDGDFTVALNAPALGRGWLGERAPALEAAWRAGLRATTPPPAGVAAVDVTFRGTPDATGTGRAAGSGPCDGERGIAAATVLGVLDAVLGPGASSLADATTALERRGIPLHVASARPAAGAPPRVEVRLTTPYGEERFATQEVAG